MRGKVIVLSFLASWCPLCEYEAQTLSALQQHFPRDKFQVVAIGVHDRTSALRRFAAKNRLEIPILVDANSVVASAYGIDSLPTTVVLDHTGAIAAIALTENGIPTRRITGLWVGESAVRALNALILAIPQGTDF